MMTAIPSLSIITPCLNRAGSIARAVESVSQQGCPDVEHIVVDGGSTDETLPVLSRYPYLSVFSQPDSGVYDALNKGILQARAPLIGQLNSDDFYEPDVFPAVLEAFRLHPEVDALVGSALLFENGPGDADRILMQFPAPRHDELPARVTLGAPIFNAWFFRRAVFEQLGGYDLRYRIAADRDFLLRFILAGKSFLPLDKVVYRYCQHPGSLTFSRRAELQAAARAEYYDIAERYSSLPDAPTALRSACLQWHTRETVEACARHLYLKQFFQAWYDMRRGIKMNPAWLSALWKRLSPALMRRLAGKSEAERA